MVFHMQWFLGMKIQQQMQAIQLWTMPLFPYQTNAYAVYNNGSLVLNTGSWSTSEKISKFTIVMEP